MADDWLKTGIASIQDPEAGDTLAESAFRRVQGGRGKMGQSPEYPGEAKSIPHGLTYDVSQALKSNFFTAGLGQYFQDLATEQPSGKPLDWRYIAAALDSPTGSIAKVAAAVGVPVWWLIKLIKQRGRRGASEARWSGEHRGDMIEQYRMERARRMGFGEEVLYHGTKQDIHQFIPGYDDGLTFVTTNPDFANQWVGQGKYRARLGAEDEIASIRKAQEETRRNLGDWERIKELTGDEWTAAYDAATEAYKRAEPVSAEDVYSAIYPVRSNVKNTFDPRKDYPVIEDFLRKRGIKRGDTSHIEKGLHKEGNWLIYENQEVVEELKRLGYDSMWIKESSTAGAPHETLAIFDPKNIRSSISAEYDPALSESPIITKAHGGFVDKPLYDSPRMVSY